MGTLAVVADLAVPLEPPASRAIEAETARRVGEPFAGHDD